MASADDKSYDDINVTPMVDLYLVLLLIFIIMTTAGVQGVKVFDAFDRTFVFVAVSVRSGRESKILTGSVEMRESAESAGVLAVLDATNRWIEHN